MSHPIRFPLALLLALTGFLAAAGTAHAAQSYDACQGQFIDSLPVTISTQGVWCLRKDLATGITSGAAITIAANNVTIDCNDFKLGGLNAGTGTSARGIHSVNHLNIAVRNCNIRGFHAGVYLDGSTREQTGGHVIANNRFNSNTRYGIYVRGDGSLVEHNVVLDTGGSTSNLGAAQGITAYYDIDVIDNLVSNVAALPNAGGSASAYGIQAIDSAGTVRGNRVRGLAVQGSGVIMGISGYNFGGERTSVHDNDIVGPGAGSGVYCVGTAVLAYDNAISAFGEALSGCTDQGNHVGP